MDGEVSELMDTHGLVLESYADFDCTFRVHDGNLREGYLERPGEAVEQSRGEFSETRAQLEGDFGVANMGELQELRGMARDKEELSRLR